MTTHALVARQPSVAPIPAPAVDETDVVVQHRTFGAVLRRRWRTLLVASVAGVALAALYVDTVTPQYEATAALWVPPAASHGAAEVEALRSRTIAAEVVDSLGLRLRVERPAPGARGDLLRNLHVAAGDDSATYALRRSGAGFAVAQAGAAQPLGAITVGRPAHFGPIDVTLGGAAAAADEIRLRLTGASAAIDQVQHGIAVSDPAVGTGVMTLRYRDTDPGLARDVLGAYVARHLARRRDAEATRARSTADELQAQLDTVTQARVAAERAVRDFRRRHRVVDTKEEAAAQVRHVVDLEAQRASIEAERQSLTELLTEVQGARTPADYQRLLAYPTLLRTPAATDLLRQLSDIETERAALPFRPTPGAADAASLAARARDVEGQVRALVRTYLAGLRKQEAATDGQIARVNAELTRIPGREAELEQLQRAPEALGERERALQKRIEDARVARTAAGPSAELVDPPSVSSRPVTPRSAPDLGLGLLAGLVAGSGLAVTRDRRDRSVRSREDLRVASGLPVLSAVPVIHADGAGAEGGATAGGLRAGVLRLVRGDDVLAPSASPSDVMGEIIDTADPVLDDAYARLYLNVLQRTDSQARSILVASALPAEGRTTTSLGLATTLARRGLRVLLMDADLRRGTLAQDYFGLSPNATGLAELLRGTVKLKSALRVVRLDERASLTYMASGRGADRAAVVVDAGAMRVLLTQLTSLFEAVVIDSPPLNLVTDGALIATLTDAVILVGRTGVTDSAALAEAAALLRGLGAHVVGTLLNAVDPRRDRATRESREYYRLAAAQNPRTLAVGEAAAATRSPAGPTTHVETPADTRGDVNASLDERDDAGAADETGADRPADSALDSELDLGLDEAGDATDAVPATLADAGRRRPATTTARRRAPAAGRRGREWGRSGTGEDVLGGDALVDDASIEPAEGTPPHV